MQPTQNKLPQEWWTPDIRFDPEQGYVMLQLPKVALPELHYKSIDFIAKDELHCSLLAIPKLAEYYFADAAAAAPKLYKVIKEQIEKTPITFAGFGKTLYFCADEDVRTVVVGASLSGLDALFSVLRQTFAELKDAPDPALHVTLYRYNHPFGIGIQNAAERDKLCTIIPKTDLTDVRKVLP